MVWGGNSLEGHTDLHVLNSGNLTGARYRYEILWPSVRPYAGAVGPWFLLVHDNAQPHVARVCQRGQGHCHNRLARSLVLNPSSTSRTSWSMHSALSKPTKGSPGAHQHHDWGLTGFRSWVNPGAVERAFSQGVGCGWGCGVVVVVVVVCVCVWLGGWGSYPSLMCF